MRSAGGAVHVVIEPLANTLYMKVVIARQRLYTVQGGVAGKRADLALMGGMGLRRGPRFRGRWR